MAMVDSDTYMEVGAKALAVSMIYLVTVPGFFSVPVSISAFLYFTAMLYHKIVKQYYGGSWRAYLNDIYGTTIKKLGKMKLKEIFWTKDGFRPWPNLFAWLIAAIAVGLLLRWVL